MALCLWGGVCVWGVVCEGGSVWGGECVCGGVGGWTQHIYPALMKHL